MKWLEKLVTLAMPEHDISQDVEKAIAGESHFLWNNYSVFLFRKKYFHAKPLRRKESSRLYGFARKYWRLCWN